MEAAASRVVVREIESRGCPRRLAEEMQQEELMEVAPRKRGILRKAIRFKGVRPVVVAASGSRNTIP